MKVSIVTPTLALDDFLKEARASVARQAPDIEIEHLIAIDDRAVALPADEVSANVTTRYMHNAGNKGPGGARNTALERAGGAIVFFLDADDIWQDDHVRNAVRVYMVNPEVDCISVAGLSFGEGIAQPRLTIPDLPEGVISKNDVAWNPIGGPTGFSFRRTDRTRDVRFKDALYYADIIFYLELLHLGAVFWRENSVRYWYRRSPGQLISLMPTDKIRASEALVRHYVTSWTDAGLSSWQARLAKVQIRRLTGNRLRRRDYGNTALLAAMAPRWATAQIRRQIQNLKLGRQSPDRPAVSAT